MNIFLPTPDRIRVCPAAIRCLLAFASGLLMVAAMPPWHLWPALIAGLGLLYALYTATQTARQAFALGWLYGFGYFLCGLSWIANALMVPGNPFAAFWPLAMAGLPALLAFFPAFSFWLARKFDKTQRTLSGFLFFVAALCLSEWLRGHLFTGFPWNLTGYTWDGVLPMAQLCAVTGIYGLSFLTILWMAAPGFLAAGIAPRRIKMFLLVFIIASAGSAFTYGTLRLSSSQTTFNNEFIVRIVQPNIPEQDKWDPEKTSENFYKLLKLSAAENENAKTTTLILWPETAVSDYLLANDTAAQAVREMLSAYTAPVYILAGILRHQDSETGREEDTRYFNSLAVFDRSLSMLTAYDKSHLVPFGEYIPLQKWIPLTPFVNFSGFVPGPGPQTIALPGLPSFSPLVCYEIIFPGAVIDPRARPDVIVNVTNDAWYGDSAGPRQHFAMAKFRAIETGIPVIRSANTGLSGAFDPYGRLIYTSKLFTDYGHNIYLPTPLESAPLYSHFSPMLPLVMLGALAGLALILKHREPHG